MKKIVAKETYRGVYVQFVHNDPVYKKGDEVIYFNHKTNLYEKVTLTKVIKTRRHGKDIAHCWGCIRGKTVQMDAYRYVWNGNIAESSIIDPVKKLNKYIELVDTLRKKAENDKLTRIREILYEE